jgi:hypothetical protein
MTIVHDFEVWDINTNEWRRHTGTEERIREAKGRIIPGTARDVDPSLIDRFGSYRPVSDRG